MASWRNGPGCISTSAKSVDELVYDHSIAFFVPPELRRCCQCLQAGFEFLNVCDSALLNQDRMEISCRHLPSKPVSLLSQLYESPSSLGKYFAIAGGAFGRVTNVENPSFGHQLTFVSNLCPTHPPSPPDFLAGVLSCLPCPHSQAPLPSR
jgi:hypothetical protein